MKWYSRSSRNSPLLFLCWLESFKKAFKKGRWDGRKMALDLGGPLYPEK
jgi:hypothetical protein